MVLLSLELPAVIIISLATLAGILVDDLRLRTGLLVMQYLCIFILISIHLPMALAIVLLFSGLIAAPP